MISNYKTITLLRVLKSVIDLFIDTFFVMYFLNLSNNNIIPLAVFYLIVYATVYITIFSVKNFCKRKKRVNLLRIGILLNFVYFLIIFLLRENMVHFSWLIAIIYGLEEGFYYSVYNNFESSGIKNGERKKYLGIICVLKSILSIIIPLIFGSVMSVQGFEKCLIIVLVLVAFQIILSFIYKDEIVNEQKRTDFKSFVDLVGKNEKIKTVYKMYMFNGIIYSGAFRSIIAIYIIRVFTDSFSYGIFTSVFAAITAIVGFYFAKLSKPKNYKKNLVISCILTALGILIIMFKCNFVTIIIFNLLQSYSKTIVELINSNALSDISNMDEIKNKYKVEYFVGMESCLVVGRITSYLLFLLMGIINTNLFNNIILIIFTLLIIVFTMCSINVQRSLQEEKNEENFSK